jgi:hypothetical protein
MWIKNLRLPPLQDKALALNPIIYFLGTTRPFKKKHFWNIPEKAFTKAKLIMQDPIGK